MMRIAGPLLVAAMISAANPYASAPGIVPVRQTLQDPQTTFRARADFVAVDVVVRQRGRPVTGLTAADFELFDNGAPQAIADLSYEKLPIDVTIALDVSGSVTGDVIDQLRRSVNQLTVDLGKADRLKLLTFNTRIQRLLDFSSPGAKTDAAFDQIRTRGATAIFDAIAVALTAPAAPDRRQLIVVFSDGEDSASISDPKVLLDVARETTPTLAVVLASTRVRSAMQAARSQAAIARTQMYSQLARETGGVVESVLPGDDLRPTFRRVLSDFRTSYVLHFVPRDVGRAGVHTIDVRVKRSDVDVRARKSYTWR